MDRSRYHWTKSAALCLFGVAAATHAQTQTNTVGFVGQSAYVINDEQNPTLTLQRGVTYVFQISANNHPFFIQTNFDLGGEGAYNLGVTPVNGIQVGTLRFAVPASAPDVLRYQCGNHGAMGGTFNIVSPPAPPTVRIVHISVTDTHVVLKSTGASNWNALPEYNCDAAGTNWTSVSSYTNSFSEGTNTTMFDRLDPLCGPGLFFRMRNQQQ